MTLLQDENFNFIDKKLNDKNNIKNLLNSRAHCSYCETSEQKYVTTIKYKSFVVYFCVLTKPALITQYDFRFNLGNQFRKN